MSTSAPKKPSPSLGKTQSSGHDALASLRIERAESGGSFGKWKWLIGLLLLLVAGFGGYQVFVGSQSGSDGVMGGSSSWMPDIMQNKVNVRLASVTVQKGRSADAVVVATGYLESRRQAKIGARAAGRIDVIFFEEGVRVKRGELLAELEHQDLLAALAAAAASVERSKAALAEQEIVIEQAEVDKSRAEKLWKSRSVSESEYDQTRFAYRSAVARRDSMASDIVLAEAQMRQAEQLKENMFIRAPFDGTIISKDAEVGESILPGGMGEGSGRGSVATIADLENLEIECDVQEDFISRVVEGQETDIAVDAVQHKKYHGVVRKIIPMGDRARATIKVKVTITDADQLLFPEMAGTVYFLPTEQELETSEEPRMFCPASAVTSDEGGNQFVWVADGDKRAKRLPVKAGEKRDTRIEILEGLTGNERVIVNPGNDISDGTPLTIDE